MKKIKVLLLFVLMIVIIFLMPNLRSQSGISCCDEPVKNMLSCCCAWRSGYEVSWCDNGCVDGRMIWMTCVYEPAAV